MSARRHVVPDQFARCMSPADRAALGVELAEEAFARGDAKRESVFQKQAEQWLSLQGIEYLHLSPRAREKQGWPDLVFAVCGRAVALELKTATGRLSEDQKACLARLAANGWHTAVCRSLPEVRDIVQAIRAGAWHIEAATREAGE